MVKTITKVGNSQGIIFDSALTELTHRRLEDAGHYVPGTRAWPPERGH